jgi:ComF family protein
MVDRDNTGKDIIKKAFNLLINIVLPEKCPTCKGSSDEHRTAPFCTQCWSSISLYTGPQCNVCGKPLVSPYAITCSECIVILPPFTRARFFGTYEGVLRQAIYHLKFFGKKRLSRPLAHFLAPLVPDDCDTLIPVPIHTNRLRQRQFNQSAMIAKELSKLCGVPMTWDSLLKIKETRPQVGLHAHQRRENVKGSFGIEKAGAIKNKNVLLIDDVITTGATVRECSQVLKKSGSWKIYVLALAHG